MTVLESSYFPIHTFLWQCVNILTLIVIAVVIYKIIKKINKN